MRTLLNKIEKAARNSVIAITFLSSLSFFSCKEIFPILPKNEPPIINSVPENQVDEKKLYEYVIDAEDPNGDKVIYSFEGVNWLKLSENKLSGFAPDVEKDTTYYMKINVSDGNLSATQEWNLLVKEKSLDQILQLVNDVEIKYDANLVNVESAELKIFRNDETEPLLSRTIDTKDYSEIFTYSNTENKLIKGDYTFVLENPEGIIDSTGINIPNYLPDVDLSSISADFNEEGSFTATLPIPTDKNPEDNPVKYSSATSEKVSASLEENQLTITGNRDAVGEYIVKLSFGNENSGIGTKDLEGIIEDMLDISGILEDCESLGEIPRQGVIEIYDKGDDPNFSPLIVKDYLNNPNSTSTRIITSPLGEFNFQVEEKLSEILNTILQARIFGNEFPQSKWDSYVETIQWQFEDYYTIIKNSDGTNNYQFNEEFNGPIRPVPYTGLENITINLEDIANGIISPEEKFKSYLSDINYRLSAWNFETFKGIKILEEHPNGSTQGSFTSEQYNLIKDKILALDDINSYVQGRINEIEHVIEFTDEFNNDTSIQGELFWEYNFPERDGWIYIVPDSTLITKTTPEGGAGVGLTDVHYSPVSIYGATIVIYPPVVSVIEDNKVISHEFGHAFIAPSGHPARFDKDSIMGTSSESSKILKPVPIPDIKAGKMLYNKKDIFYKDLEDVLGLEFLNGNKD